MDRRHFLKYGTLSGLTFLGSGFSSYGFERLLNSDPQKKLVVIILSGGADGLSLFPPHGDDELYARRPRMAKEMDFVPLTDLFAIHSQFRGLRRAWQEGEAGIIQQIGSPTAERSHALATQRMGRGIDVGPGPMDGFLNRALFEKFGASVSPFRAVAVQLNLPLILQGLADTVSIPSLGEFVKHQSTGFDALDLKSFYEMSDDIAFKQPARYAFPLIEGIRGILAREARTTRSEPSFAERTGGGFRYALRDIATLINSGSGLRMAVTAGSGWDTHIFQEHHLANRIIDLDYGLAEFRASLKSSGNWKDTLVVVLTEFGRAVNENGSQGTDHGHASASFVMGGALPASMAGKIVHKWRPLKPENLSLGRELPIVFDYRDMMSEALISQLQLDDNQLKNVFPGHSRKKVGFLV